MKYRIKIRTPDDITRWTAIAEGVVSETQPYLYTSDDVVVDLQFFSETLRKPADFSFLTMPRPVPKPSQTKKSRSKKVTTTDDE